MKTASLIRIVPLASTVMAALALLGANVDNLRTQPITAYWTGAKNQYWCDSGNWVVPNYAALGVDEHTVPGITTNYTAQGDCVYTGHRADQAIFEQTADRQIKTYKGVNFARMVCISNVIFRGDQTPAVTFSGTMPLIDGGALRVESSVVNTPVPYAVSTPAFYARSNPHVYFENYATGRLEVAGCWGYNDATYRDPFAAKVSNVRASIYIRGTGDFRFRVNQTCAANTDIHLEQQGNAQFSTTSPWVPGNYAVYVERPDDSEQVIDVPARSDYAYQNRPDLLISKFAFQDYYSYGLQIKKGNTRITGGGFTCYRADAHISVEQDTILTLESQLTNAFTGATYPNIVKVGAGTLRMTNSWNVLPNGIRVDAGCVEVAQFGLAGVQGVLGANGVLGAAGTGLWRHTGAAETTDRQIWLDAGAGGLDLGTGGDVTFAAETPVVNKAKAATTLTLAGTADSSAVGTFTHALADTDTTRKLGVAVTGGAWRFNAAPTFTAPLTLAGGTLQLDAVDTLAAPVVFNGQGGTLHIVGGDDEARTVDLALSNGVENIYGRITFTGKVNLNIRACTLAAGALDIDAALDDANVTVRYTGSTPMSGAGYLAMKKSKVVFNASGEPVWACTDASEGILIDGIDARVDWARTNTYTGKTILMGTNNATYLAGYPTTIPDYSKVEASYSALIVPTKDCFGDTAWTALDIIKLANGAKLTSAFVAIDTTYDDDAVELALDDNAITSDTFAVGANGPQNVILTGNWTKPVGFGAYAGTLMITGGVKKLGAGIVSAYRGAYNFPNGESGKVVIDGVKATLSDDNRPITIGGAPYTRIPSSYNYYRGDMVIRNSQICNTRLSVPTEKNHNFVVGHGDRGRVAIGTLTIAGKDTVITSSFEVAQQYNCRAAVYQEDGEVVAWGSDNNNSGANYFGYNGAGYWELQKGRFVQSGSVRWATNQGGSDAIFAQFGGESLFTGRGNGTIWYFGGGVTTVSNFKKDTGTRNGGARTMLYIAGGTCTISNLNLRAGSDQAAPSQEVTVDGPNACLRVHTSASLALSYQLFSRITFNICNGGTFETAQPLRKSTYLVTTDTNREVVVNLNGGVIRAGANNLNLFGDSTTDAYRTTRVNVYEDGVTFDTNGKDMSLYVPLTGATGQGIASVTLKDTIYAVYPCVGPYSTYVKPANGNQFPCLTGDFACLMALYDHEKNCVTNMRVVSPGCGYTSTAEVKLYAGNTGISDTYRTVTMRTVTSGNLVKTGAGTLVLGAPNSYAGYTIISNGVLKLACADALLAGKARTVKCCGGTLAAAEGAFYPDDLVLDVSDLPFADKARYTVAENWTKSTLPELVGAPAKWFLVQRGSELKVQQLRGLVIIFR